jgi:tripartite-type tricarboxylate transporter receptor subunit TctC
MTLLDRRQALALVATLPGAALASVHEGSGAIAWPERTVRIVSPLAPGGPNDVCARLIGQRLQERSHIPFLIENRPGAATRIGNAAVARAAPDGTTLLCASAALAVLPSLYSNLPYDWRVNLVPITLAAAAPLFLVVGERSPARNLREYIALARDRPTGLTFVGPGVATVPHLITELLIRTLGITGQTVHFNGEAAATVELLAGRVDAAITSLTSTLTHIQQGKLRVLAVASNQRSPLYPSAPTLVEQGVVGVSGSAWFGFLAPAGLHPTLIDAIHKAITDVLADARVTQVLAGAGLQAMASTTPEEFSAFIVAEARKWNAVIKDSNIKVE